jgi:hypothetical protein
VGRASGKPCLTAGAGQLNLSAHALPGKRRVLQLANKNYVVNPETGREKAVLNETNTAQPDLKQLVALPRSWKRKGVPNETNTPDVHFRKLPPRTTGLEACSLRLVALPERSKTYHNSKRSPYY